MQPLARGIRHIVLTLLMENKFSASAYIVRLPREAKCSLRPSFPNPPTPPHLPHLTSPTPAPIPHCVASLRKTRVSQPVLGSLLANLPGARIQWRSQPGWYSITRPSADWWISVDSNRTDTKDFLSPSPVPKTQPCLKAFSAESPARFNGMEETGRAKRDVRMADEGEGKGVGGWVFS